MAFIDDVLNGKYRTRKEEEQEKSTENTDRQRKYENANVSLPTRNAIDNDKNFFKNQANTNRRKIQTTVLPTRKDVKESIKNRVIDVVEDNFENIGKSLVTGEKFRLNRSSDTNLRQQNIFYRKKYRSRNKNRCSKYTAGNFNRCF